MMNRMLRREEGKYKNNVLVSDSRKKGLLFGRASKMKERVEASVDAAQRAAQIAQVHPFFPFLINRVAKMRHCNLETHNSW